MSTLNGLSTRAALAALLGGLLAVACDTNPEPLTVFCEDFSIGSDFSQSTFGVSVEVAKPYVAFAQAVSDMAIMASTLHGEVGTACRDLAMDFGASADDPRLAEDTTPGRTPVWCALAAEGIAAKRDLLRAAQLSMWFRAPRCLIDTIYQTTCEGRCLGDLACVEVPLTERCGAADVVSTCSGRCTGTCEGSEEATSACDGACAGACIGACIGGVAGEERGTRCTGRCVGRCTASCTFASDSVMRCDAPCRGGCDGSIGAVSCAGALAPPTCVGDVDCQASCRASAAARASCEGGALVVAVAGSGRADPSIAALVQSLERNLPTIFVTARGRGQVLNGHASSLVDTAGHLMHRDDLGREGAACAMLIAETGVAAGDNVRSALDGAKRVASAVDDTTRR